VLKDASGGRPWEDDVCGEGDPRERAQQPVAGPEGCRLGRDCQLDPLDGVAASGGTAAV
jgi:hypothetical protein